MIDRSSKLKISIYPNQQGVDIDDPEEDLKKLSPIEIPLNQLRLNEPASKMKQPESRKQLKKFIDKIRRGMNINPIVVRKLDNKYQILDGHHRFFAHKALGIDKIKAVVVEPRFIEVLGEGRKKRKKVNYYWPAFFGDGSAEAADGGGDGGGLEETAKKKLTAIHLNKEGTGGKINEQEMSQDDFNTIGNVLRDPTKAKQIHSLLLQMFPQQKELLNYNYKNDSYAEFKRFIFHIDKYKLEGPVSINYTNLKLDPENMKARERKYQEYIDGKIDKYFRDTNSDPRKVDLSKMPPITVDETGEVMDGNHRAFLAIKQQKPLKGYKIVNANNTHPNVAKILQIVGREVKENYADGKVNESGYEEAWELLGQPAPEIKNFVKQLGLKNDDATAKKVGAIIDSIKDSFLPANKIPGLKNLANKGNDSETLEAIKQISGKPDAEQQYIKLMQARDAGEKRNRGYDVSDLIKKVKSGNYDPPVLLQLPSGLYVIGGRTRLYAALALGVKAKVKIITSDTFKQVKENYADGKVNEAKQVGNLYHYTSADGLKGILQSNSLNASEEEYLGNELYYISFTRNKNFHNKGQKFNVKTDYRITFDGDKLSNRYKIKPFAYKPGWNYEYSWEFDWLEDEPESVARDFFDGTGDYDEQEERIFFKDRNGSIPNIKDFILKVDKVSDLKENFADGNNLNENLNKNLVQEFIKHVKSELELDKFPPIKLSDDSQKAIDLRSWGGYQPSDKTIYIVIAKRHPADVFRTLAHELVHYKQDLEGRLKPDSGMTGSKEENEANSRAAIIMRNFAQAKPNLFEHLNK